MDFLKNYKRDGILHHAYLLLGDRKILLPSLFRFIENDVGIATSGNPDFWQAHFDIFGIDEARTLKEMQNRKSFSGGKKIFVISLNSITREAQNSLLKVFEEPTEDTHFFVIASSAENFIPTLRSRFFVLDKKKDEDVSDLNRLRSLADNFLKQKPPERFVLLKKIIDDKERMEAISFLNALEWLLQTKTKSGYTPETVSIFDEIAQSRSYLYDRAPSIKIILEHLALIMPTM